MSDKQHFTVVRNAGYTATEFKTRQRHNERQNENYHNGDIVAERSELNHHYLKYAFPDGSPVTYEERFNQLLAADIIAKRGLKPDAKVFAELVFGVNSEYFEQNGGYDYAVKFFDEAYRLAVKEVGVRGTYYPPSSMPTRETKNYRSGSDMTFSIIIFM